MTTARITQTTGEVIRAGAPTARLTQICVEVLRASGFVILTPTDVASATSITTSTVVNIGQPPTNIASNDISAATSITDSLLSTIRELAVNDVSSSTSVTALTLGILATYDLVVNDISAATSITTSDFSVDSFGINSNDISAATEITSPTLVHGIPVTASTISAATEITTPYLVVSVGAQEVVTASVHERSSLVCDNELMEGRMGWFYDRYTPKILLHYGEEGPSQQSILCGGSDGSIYALTGESDNGSDIICRVRSLSADQGDPRKQKFYGDVLLDANAGGGALIATAGFDNHTVTLASIPVGTSSRTQSPVIMGGSWRGARNVSLDIGWYHNNNRAYLYAWEPRFTEDNSSLLAYTWSTDHTSHDLDGFFYHGYLYLVHVSTADLTFTITDTDGIMTQTVTITNSSGYHAKDLIRLPVMKGKLFYYSLSSATPFYVEGEDSELLVKEWSSEEEWKRMRIFQDLYIQG